MYDEQPLVAVRIKDGIFCGNVTAAYDEDFLIMNKVTHIINCAGGETRDLYKNAGIQYLNFPWSQPSNASTGPNLFDASDKNIETVIRFIDETLAQGECVLVQSVHGRSRSCAMVAAYFVIKYRWTLDHALDFIAMAHEDMDIHPLFRKQLAQFYQKHEVPASQTGRALDIFHPEIDDAGFALDNEQWMLRNTYVNGLVSEVQEKTDLYKVTTSRVALAEPSAKTTAKRRRRITFCDTKQGTSVACMWTQPVVQPRAPPTPVIAPPGEISVPIVARSGTPNTHRLEGEATASVHTATPITAIGIPGDPHRANTIKLQLRSNIVNLQQQQQQQQQQRSSGSGGTSNNSSSTIASGLNLQRDSPMIGRGPALVATGSLSSSSSSSSQQQLQQQQQQDQDTKEGGQQQQQYNQTVSRILPAQQQDRGDYSSHFGESANTQNNNNRQQQGQNDIPRAFNNNNSNNSSNASIMMVRSSNQQPQQQQQQQQQAQAPPTAANIAASLGTTGQGNLITLRGGAPLSVIATASSATTTATTTLSSSGGNGNGNNNTSNVSVTTMRPIPDASSGIRPLGPTSPNPNMTTTSPSFSGYGNNSTSTTNASNNNNNNNINNNTTTNGTTPIRPGPTVRGNGGSTTTLTTSSGVHPGHNRNNPFTLPASGRTVHRGSPLPMQRNSGNSSSSGSNATNSNAGIGFGGTRLLAGTSASSSQQQQQQQRTNSPIRNNAAFSTLNGSGNNNNNISNSAYSPLAVQRSTFGGGSGSSLGSPRTNSPLVLNRNAVGTGTGTGTGGGGSPIRTSSNLTSFPQYQTQQRATQPGLNTAGTSVARGNSPSSVGNRPSSPSRPPAPMMTTTTTTNNLNFNNNNNSNLFAGSSSSTGAGAGAGVGVGTGRSMLGGVTSSSQWSSSLLPASSSSSSQQQNRPRTGSPLVRSNSPIGNSSTFQQQQQQSLRAGNSIPTASSHQVYLQNPPPPSRPTSLSQQLMSSLPSSHIPRQNSPLVVGRRTGSPIRSGPTSTSAFGSTVTTTTAATAMAGPMGLLSSSSSSSSSMVNRTNSPLAANRNGGGGGTLAEQFLYRSSANVSNGVGRNSPLARR